MFDKTKVVMKGRPMIYIVWFIIQKIYIYTFFTDLLYFGLF